MNGAVSKVVLHEIKKLCKSGITHSDKMVILSKINRKMLSGSPSEKLCHVIKYVESVLSYASLCYQIC